MRAGKPCARPPGTPTPCWTCPKTAGQPVRDRQHAVNLTARNRQALWYAELCRVDTQGLLPRDETTLKLLALIHLVTESHQRQQADVVPILLTLLKKRP